MKEKLPGQVLICENYPGLREAFKLVLGDHYDLVFAESQEEIIPLVRQRPVRLVIWDIDRMEDSLDKTFEAVRNGDAAYSPQRVIPTEEVLSVLKSVRGTHPDLPILLVAGEIDTNFQITAIQQVGSIRFLTKPWDSSVAVAEQIQVMLGDKKSSIRHWILRTPLAEPFVNQE